MVLIDSDILIDYLRLYPAAQEFLEGLPVKERALAVISQLELLQGCRKKEEEAMIDRFLKHFKIFPITPKISERALRVFREGRWKTQLSIPDSFIAATALSHHLTLVTRNEKHYAWIPGLVLKKPYR